jgi:hypothetical protein
VISDLGVELVAGTWFFTRNSVRCSDMDVKSFVRYYVAGLKGIPGAWSRGAGGGLKQVRPEGLHLHKLLILDGLVRFLATGELAWFVFSGVADRIIVLVLRDFGAVDAKVGERQRNASEDAPLQRPVQRLNDGESNLWLRSGCTTRWVGLRRCSFR